MNLHPSFDSARQVLVAVNPKSGAKSGRDRVDELVRLLSDRDYDVQEVNALDEIAARANQGAADGKLRALVGAGGDGTAAELVNRTRPGVPLVMLPLGTENLLAKYLRQSPSPADVCQTIFEGNRVQLDAGDANGRIFLLMVGCGFDAEVVRRLHEVRTGHIRHWSYFKPILHSIRKYKYPAIRVYCDDQGRQQQPAVTARWAFAFNLPRYGGHLPLEPRANGSDGLLDVSAFAHGGLLNGVKYLTAIVTRTRGWLRDFWCARSGSLRLESDEPVPFQLDGDPGGWLPLTITVLPGRLTVLVPNRWLRCHGKQIQEG